MFKEVKVYDSIPDIMRDVNLGRIKAGFADYPIVAYNLSLGSFPETRLAKNYKAAVVGSVLIVINHGDAILRGDLSRGRLFRMALTVLVPYCVSTYSSVQALRRPGPGLKER